VTFVTPSISGGNSRPARAQDAVERRLRIPHKKTINILGTAARTYTGNTFAVVASGTADEFKIVGFVKYRDDTKIVMTGHLPHYLTTGAAIVYLGGKINGVNYSIADRPVNEINSGKSISGTVEVAAGVVPKGTYTVQMLWASSANTINFDTQCRGSFSVEETY